MNKIFNVNFCKQLKIQKEIELNLKENEIEKFKFIC